MVEFKASLDENIRRDIDGREFMDARFEFFGQVLVFRYYIDDEEDVPEDKLPPECVVDT